MTKLISPRILTLLLLLAAPGAAAAQRAPVRPLAVGDTVRVVTPDQVEGPVVGVLTAYEYNGMTVRQRASGVERTIPFPEVRGLARSLGVRRAHNAWRGAQMGAFTLGAAGAVAGPLAATGDADDEWEIPETTALTLAAGALVGGAIGGTLGWVLAREEWQAFQTPATPRVALRADGAAVVGFTLTR